MNKQPTEHDMTFRIWYSYYVEVMTECLNRRIDTFSNAVILALGTGVMAQSRLGWLFGGIIAVITAVRMSWHFGVKAEAASQQAKRYLRLVNDMHNLNAGEMLSQLRVLEDFDSVPLSGLLNPARNRAYIALGDSHHDALSPAEKIISFLAGGVPR